MNKEMKMNYQVSHILSKLNRTRPRPRFSLKLKSKNALLTKINFFAKKEWIRTDPK